MKPKLCDYRTKKPVEWSMEQALTNPVFFDTYVPGDVAFESYDNGKSVYGFGKYIPLEERYRDLTLQKHAGGEWRRPHDQGGDLLAISMSGLSLQDNLVPMDSKLNQGAYKSLELALIGKLKDGDDLYVEISSLNNDEQSERPDFFTYNWVSRNSEGNARPITSYLNELKKLSNAQLVYIKGNHDQWLDELSPEEKQHYFLLVIDDRQNGRCVIERNGWRIGLSHVPTEPDLFQVPVHACICSHIHNNRSGEDYERFLRINAEGGNLLNCGVDINDYKPVSLRQMITNNERFYGFKYSIPEEMLQAFE